MRKCSITFVHIAEYRGVYMLTDERDNDGNRVPITHHSDPTLSGYLMEWDRHTHVSNAHFTVVSDGVTIPFMHREPNENPSSAEREFTGNFVRNVGVAIERRDFDELSQLIDVSSFVDFYLVNELFKNRDVGFSSLFFHIKHRVPGTSSPILVAGPLWDFDQSSGAVVDGIYTDSPQGVWAAGGAGTEGNVWFRLLLEIPEFRTLVVNRWNEIKDREVRTMLNQAKFMAETYQACFLRNFTVPGSFQPGDNNWRTPAAIRQITTFQGQVNYFIDWMEQRIVWMSGFLQ